MLQNIYSASQEVPFWIELQCSKPLSFSQNPWTSWIYSKSRHIISVFLHKQCVKFQHINFGVFAFMQKHVILLLLIFRVL